MPRTRLSTDLASTSRHRTPPTRISRIEHTFDAPSSAPPPMRERRGCRRLSGVQIERGAGSKRPSYDVLVAGGGNAGCAAAIAAARSGARTLLVEKYGFLGGTATAAMVGPWMTFHSGTDRIVGGIAQEIVERLIVLGGSPGHIPDSSGYVPTITPFDPEIHKALLFDLMRESNVHLLLHALVVDAVCEG